MSDDGGVILNMTLNAMITIFGGVFALVGAMAAGLITEAQVEIVGGYVVLVVGTLLFCLGVALAIATARQVIHG